MDVYISVLGSFIIRFFLMNGYLNESDTCKFIFALNGHEYEPNMDYTRIFAITIFTKSYFNHQNITNRVYITHK